MEKEIICSGNNGNGCFMDSCGHNCGCEGLENKWTPILDTPVKRFLSNSQDEIIYAINTGFQDRWMVVFLDAYEVSLGTTFIGTKKEVENKFNIML